MSHWGCGKQSSLSSMSVAASFVMAQTWASPLLKLYIVSVEAKPIYVGVTRQSMRSRFRMGFKATGESGYYGYAWRHKFKEAVLDIWCHEGPLTENPERDIETVEAEVVILARCAGQWPEVKPKSTSTHPRKSTAKLLLVSGG